MVFARLCTLVLAVSCTVSASASNSLGTPSSPPAFRPRVISSSIELAGSLTRTTTTYVLKPVSNSVGSSAAGTREWIVGVQGDGRAFVEASVGKAGAKRAVEVRQLDDKSINGITRYALNLPVPPTTDATTTVTVSSTASHQTKPHPASLPQNAEVITMHWTADLKSALAGMSHEEREAVEELKVKVKAPSPRIGDIKAPDGFTLAYTRGGATATFTSKGSLADSGPQIASMYYVQPDALSTIRSLDRIVEVSHWGAALAVQDNIDLFNSGPRLLGQFSRLDYQRASMQRRATNLAITSLSLSLPPNIRRPYYYDIVGNVSTSRFRPSTPPNQALLPSQRKAKANTVSTLELSPRFPLMGGWNYTFTIGYDAPLGDFEKRRRMGEYVLAVPFLTPIQDMAVDDVRLEIRLPEGASNIRVHAPFPVDSLSQDGLTRTYLDSTGRPTIVLKKLGCTDKHSGEVIIEYTLSPIMDYFRKPLIVALVSFLAFALIVVSKRVDWTIAGASSSPVEASKKVQ